VLYDSVCSVYLKDIAILKKYGDKYKLTLLRSVRRKGFEVNQKKCKSVNTEKLENNISRAKSKVFEYSMCNEFEYFITLTINPKFYDRNNLKEFYKDFSKFLNNYNTYYKTKVQYLFIPEQHKDGTWHMHGLISGILTEHLLLFDDLIKKREVPKKLLNKGYYDFIKYEEKFGFNSIGKIKNYEAVCKYITKYITKDMSKRVNELNSHMYYCSNGLNKAIEEKRGTLQSTFSEYDFMNDYVKIKWFDDISDIEII
jgi:hypothetical protein